MALPNTNTSIQSVKRIRLWYGLLVLLLVIFVIRLFHLQVIQYGYYKKAALSGQLKQYEIPAKRGLIRAYDGNQVLPIVLNQQLFTLYADPVYIKKPGELAAKLPAIVGGEATRYEKLMKTKDTRYVVLAKRLSPDQRKKIDALKAPGLGTQVQNYRTYPQASLASQLIGFVNEEGQGKYGIEQALDKRLRGSAGQMRAITDASGIPLAANKDNTEVTPRNGDDVVLTIDLAMQQQLETLLQQGLQEAKSSHGSALIMDPYSGAVKAMANFPTYDPAQFSEVTDASVFTNAAVSNSIEVGSTMKPLTTAAALDQGVINANTSYADPARWRVDDFWITNIEEDGGPGQRNITDILNLSLNTGVTWELMQMGGGQINEKARNAWYEYMSGRYRFGKLTGIEQGYESPGLVPEPADNGAGINLTYANTTFGQAMTATPIQMGAALASVINGGTYYQPRLVDQIIDSNGKKTHLKPKVLKQGVVKSKVASDLMPMMEYTVQTHNFRPGFDQSKYKVGGKTGTAQIAKPGGGYYENDYNGTYIGFVGGDNVQYVIVVFVEKPKIGGYAGSAAAQPIFGKLAHMLINDSYIMPKSN